MEVLHLDAQLCPLERAQALAAERALGPEEVLRVVEVDLPAIARRAVEVLSGRPADDDLEEGRAHWADERLSADEGERIAAHSLDARMAIARGDAQAAIQRDAGAHDRGQHGERGVFHRRIAGVLEGARADGAVGGIFEQRARLIDQPQLQGAKQHEQKQRENDRRLGQRLAALAMTSSARCGFDSGHFAPPGSKFSEDQLCPLCFGVLLFCLALPTHGGDRRHVIQKGR